LNNFFALKVPDIYKMVLRAAHNPLSASYGKLTKDTIFVVDVPFVCLQAL
jgi:hypothetical protein